MIFRNWPVEELGKPVSALNVQLCSFCTHRMDKMYNNNLYYKLPDGHSLVAVKLCPECVQFNQTMNLGMRKKVSLIFLSYLLQPITSHYVFYVASTN